MHDEEESLYADRPEAGPEVSHGPRVVVAVDGSAGSRAALGFALEDAARRGVPVVAVIVYRLPDWQGEYLGLGPVEGKRFQDSLGSQFRARAQSVVDDAVRDHAGALPDVEVRAELGAPADVLVRESHGADLLVVGSRGHGGFHTMLLGSTSIQCATHATCPVTVVHSPEARRHRLRLHRQRQQATQVAAASR